VGAADAVDGVEAAAAGGMEGAIGAVVALVETRSSDGGACGACVGACNRLSLRLGSGPSTELDGDMDVSMLYRRANHDANGS
jgi:hypothetical protein